MKRKTWLFPKKQWRGSSKQDSTMPYLANIHPTKVADTTTPMEVDTMDKEVAITEATTIEATTTEAVFLAEANAEE
jgi:hypothetical protein